MATCSTKKGFTEQTHCRATDFLVAMDASAHTVFSKALGSSEISWIFSDAVPRRGWGTELGDRNKEPSKQEGSRSLWLSQDAI